MTPIRQKYLNMIAIAEKAFMAIEAVIPPPILLTFKNDRAFRFAEKTPQQMIMLKYARVISGLHTLDLLMSYGFIQEAGAIMRTLDEAEEDIQCIALAVIDGRWEPLHKKLSEYFWQEEFDEGIGSVRSLPRGMVDRAKARAWVSRAGGVMNTSVADDASRTVHKSMSGYVHSAASHAMDMYTGNPLRFALRGISDPLMLSGYVDLLIAYGYRGALTSYFVVKAVIGHDAAQPFYEAIKVVESEMGSNLFPDKPLKM